MALRYLSTGGNFSVIVDAHGIHKSTVSWTVQRVVEAVNDNIYEEFVCFPNDSSPDASNFRDIAGMPCIFGCIDGSHVPIVKPNESESQFVNRHGYHSINVLVVCVHDLRFYYCNARWPGSVNDSRILRTSSFQRRLKAGWRPFNGAVLLGDSGFPNTNYLITPILLSLSQQANAFNIAHKKTRRIVECSLGVLKERYRCLRALFLSIQSQRHELSAAAFACMTSLRKMMMPQTL